MGILDTPIVYIVYILIGKLQLQTTETAVIVKTTLVVTVIWLNIQMLMLHGWVVDELPVIIAMML